MSYGVSEGRVVVRTGAGAGAVGDVIKDAVFEQPSLNAFMAQGPGAWRETANALRTATAPVLLNPVMSMPFEVADYVDFYSSIHHATNLGRLFRPDSEPLLPNWRHLPVAYHGRSGSVAVSGTPVIRPTGLVKTDDGVVRQPSARLDIELEVGFVVGVGSQASTTISVDDADDHVFGALLVNDWSARDIQAFEYQPLGPMLGKSFLTSISAWVVPFDDLRPFLVSAPPQNPVPDAALRGTRDWALNLNLSVELNGDTISCTNFADLYWSFAQQLAHLTSNGAPTRTGDLFASGTVSGPTPDSVGSLIESGRAFLANGDTVTLRGWCEDAEHRVDFGDVTGTVMPART